jgi:hypothetical protein
VASPAATPSVPGDRERREGAVVDPTVVVVPRSGTPTADRSVVATLLSDGQCVVGEDARGLVLDHSPSGILYLGPRVMGGEAAESAVAWFRDVRHESFRRYLVTTSAQDPVLLAECEQLADEAWVLTRVVGRRAIPHFVMELVAGRGVDLIHIADWRLGFDLLPSLKSAFPSLPAVVELHRDKRGSPVYDGYVASRYESLVDAYAVTGAELRDRLVGLGVSPAKIDVIALDAGDRGGRHRALYGRLLAKAAGW